MLHAKTMLADQQISTVGSTNMDRRSFRLNFEVNAFFYGRHMNEALARSMVAMAGEAAQVQPRDFHRRPRRQKLLEAVARVFSPML